MRLYCMRKKQGLKPTKIIGVVLMAAGALTLLVFVPHWIWTGFLAVLMISVGFLLYRF